MSNSAGGGGLCPRCKIQWGGLCPRCKIHGGDFVHVNKNEQGGFCPGGIMSVSKASKLFSMQIVQPSHSLLHPSAYLFSVAYIANIMDPDQTDPM